MENVQSADVEKGNSGEVPECSGDAVVISVDNERSLPHDMSPVPDLANTSPHLAGFLCLLDIIVSSDGLHQSNSLFGFREVLNSSLNNTWNLVDLLNFVSSCHEEAGDSGCSDSRADGILPHLPVYPPVPLPPCLGGSKHASRSAHVTVSSLSGPVGTATSDSRDSSNSSSGSPGFGTGLVTGLL